MKATFELLMATMWLGRDRAHKQHLRTKGPGSLAEHSATGEFYDAIVPLSDTLAEAFVGLYDVDLDIPEISADETDSILELLVGQRQFIRDNRFKAVPRDETPLQNVIDEIELLYLSTIFKLRRLR